MPTLNATITFVLGPLKDGDGAETRMWAFHLRKRQA
jgi:hypothetical protein